MAGTLCAGGTVLLIRRRGTRARRRCRRAAASVRHRVIWQSRAAANATARQLLLAAAPRKMADAPLSDAGEAQLLEVARSLQRRRLRAVAEVVSEFKEAKEDLASPRSCTRTGRRAAARRAARAGAHEREERRARVGALDAAAAQRRARAGGARRRRRRRRPGALRRPRALQAVDQWETRDGAQPLRQRMAEKKAAFVAPSQARAARPPFRPHTRA